MHNKNNVVDERLMESANLFGTPLYVYHSEKIKTCYEALNESVEQEVDIFYSLKANPNLAIATLLNQMGAGAEICSGVELKTALQAGYSPNNIIFVGPAKKTEEIVLALDKKIYAIVCESKEEVAFINELAKTRSEIANIAIRINPDFTMRDASLKMGGVPSQFGIDQEILFKEKAYFLNMSHVNIRGVHVFNGSRLLSIETFVNNTQNIFLLSDALEKEWGLSFSLIDIGGGIGVPYFKNEKPFELKKLKQHFQPMMNVHKKSHKNKRVILESGRYLVAESGVFVSRIQNIKQSRGISFLITDGGMNCHLTAAGYGTMLKRNFPIQLLTKNNTNRMKKYHITGPLCTPADTIGVDVDLPEAKIGDYIAILASGAYGPTASPVLFLGHGHPAEAMLETDHIKLIRERDSVEDFLRKQKQ